MTEYSVRFHSDFFDDLERLSETEIHIFEKKKEKIKQNPLRFKHLGGGENCYREAITNSVRLIYYLKGKEIWMLIIDKHDDAYLRYRSRLHSLKTRYGI